MSSDTLFFTLPKRTRNRIDSAFKSATSDPANSAKSPLAGGFIHEHELGGGFVRDEEQAGGFIRDDMPSTSTGDTGGGFIVDEDESDDSNVPTHIPLSKIPSALQALDLAPDDDEVLAVFRNAATGWASSSNKTETQDMPEDGEQFVSKDDWRSVCAVLLEHDSGDGKEETNEDVDMADPSGESDDEYQNSDEEEDKGEDDDEYIEGPSTSATRRRTRQTTRKSSSLSPSPSLSPNSKDSKPRKITNRQRQACTDAYALFFPSASTEELHAQKIMIKDIQRVAKLLNEKLKTEEMVEMLETFSTSPDKSMNFEDFCRMMVAAKLA